MKIERVTFTGADNSVSPEDLVHFQKDYPFVEWGILLSKANEGNRLFPDKKWLDDLVDVANTLGSRLIHGSRPLPMLCGHLCGRWVRELLAGNFTYSEDRKSHFELWHRMQLNFHGEDLRSFRGANWYNLFHLQNWNKQYIFQIDGVNDDIYLTTIRQFPNPNATAPTFKGGVQIINFPSAVPLFDLSGGQGISPESWPKPIAPYCGYAGGLGPDNLSDELKRIEDAVGDSTIWIDFESKVRSDNHKLFDLNKVRKCCEIALPFLKD